MIYIYQHICDIDVLCAMVTIVRFRGIYLLSDMEKVPELLSPPYLVGFGDNQIFKIYYLSTLKGISVGTL